MGNVSVLGESISHYSKNLNEVGSTKVTNFHGIYRKFVTETSTTIRLTDWSVQKAEKKKWKKEELKLQALLNFCSKFKIGKKKFSLNISA